MDTDSWSRYLMFLREQIPYKRRARRGRRSHRELHDPEDTIYLFADSYRAHHSPNALQLA